MVLARCIDHQLLTNVLLFPLIVPSLQLSIIEINLHLCETIEHDRYITLKQNTRYS